MVPIYNEGFDVIRHSSMDSARREVTNYGPGANLLVLDDGLMVFANNDIEGFERQARETPTPQRTRAQREVLERLTFYREMLARPDVRFGVVARPRPVPGHPETARRGTFKKGSNLNFAHRLFDRMQAIAARPGSDGATVETALGQLLGPSRRWTYVGGEIFIGEIVLLLDKDSTVPEGVSREAVPDFGEDATLAYTQSVTSPSNPGVNFFTRMIGYYTGLLYEVAFPMATLLGATVPLVGTTRSSGRCISAPTATGGRTAPPRT